MKGPFHGAEFRRFPFSSEKKTDPIDEEMMGNIFSASITPA